MAYQSEGINDQEEQQQEEEEEVMVEEEEEELGRRLGWGRRWQQQ